jgi:hypothetical protein
MSTLNKKEISEALIKALDKENLHTREAARCLNLNPIYVSMARNENSWPAMGKAPWIRLQEWLYSRGPIARFDIPEGEEIFVPKPYIPKVKPAAKPEFKTDLKDVAKAAPEDDCDMHLPEIKEKKEVKKKKVPDQKREVNLILNKAELAALDKKFSPLFTLFENALSAINSVKQDIGLQNKYLGEIRTDIEGLKTDVDTLQKTPAVEETHAKLEATWGSPEKKKKKKGWSIVFFQRNIYQK